MNIIKIFMKNRKQKFKKRFQKRKTLDSFIIAHACLAAAAKISVFENSLFRTMNKQRTYMYYFIFDYL